MSFEIGKVGIQLDEQQSAMTLWVYFLICLETWP